MLVPNSSEILKSIFSTFSVPLFTTATETVASWPFTKVDSSTNTSDISISVKPSDFKIQISVVSAVYTA